MLKLKLESATMRSSSTGQTPLITCVSCNCSSRKSSVPVAEWLSARFLLRSLDDTVIESCYDEIMNVFCDKRETISTLIGASSSTQIKQMMNILKKSQLEQSEKAQHSNTISKIPQNTSKNSFFSFLSTESIYNICEFLENADINFFKITSTFISLIVLDIMKTYDIGVFNMNELIQQNDYKYPLHLNLNRKIKINRVKPWTKYKSLTSVYSKRYNICLSSMLILQSFKSHGFSVSMGIDYAVYNNSLCKSKIVNNMTLFNQQLIERRREFFIFDRQKIFILNNDNYNTLQTLSTIDMEAGHDSNIVLLQYFDIKRQRLQNVQFLWLNSNTTLPRFEQYIHRDLYSSYSKTYAYASHDWCLELLQTMHKMMQFETEIDILNVYLRKRVNVNTVEYVRYSSETYKLRNDNMDGMNSNEMDKDFTIITFEFNANHPYFNNISVNIMKQSHLKQPFYRNVSDCVTDRTSTYNLEFQYMYNQDRMMQHLKCCDINQVLGIYDISTQFIITPSTTFGMIKQRIVDRCKGVIGANDIEIFRGISPNTNSMISLWNKQSINDIYSVISVEYNEREIAKNRSNYAYRFEVIPHHACTYGDGYNVYNIAVYEHETDDICTAFHMECNEPQKEIHIKYGTFKQNVMSQKKPKEVLECDGNDGFVSLSMSSSPISVHRNAFMEQTENIEIEINVEDFIHTIITMMSHAMYGDEYQDCIDKYHKKAQYSFVIRKERDDCIQYYDDCTPCFCHEILDHIDGIHYVNINVLIVRNVYVDDDDEKSDCNELQYPVMVRCTTEDEQHCFGYPVRVWITKQTKLQDIVALRCFDNKYMLSSCIATEYGATMDGNDLIYDKVYSDDPESTPLLWITLRVC